MIFPGAQGGRQAGTCPITDFMEVPAGTAAPAARPPAPAGASGKTALPLRFFRRPVDIPLGNSYNHSRTNKQEGACL